MISPWKSTNIDWDHARSPLEWNQWDTVTPPCCPVMALLCGPLGHQCLQLSSAAHAQSTPQMLVHIWKQSIHNHLGKSLMVLVQADSWDCHNSQSLNGW